jgi:nicotinate-nucleotide adenylyltransferase
LFVPAGHPPHRQSGALSSYQDRLRMVEIACAADPRFEASRLEEGAAKSYSIHTIERVMAEPKPKPKPNPLYFLIGADAFAEIRSWHRWEDVARAVVFIVVSRPGSVYEIPKGAQVLKLEDVELPVSSSEIRRRLASGDSQVPVPAGVAGYIREHSLYR